MEHLVLARVGEEDVFGRLAADVGLPEGVLQVAQVRPTCRELGPD
jgi:hypothetical protein